MNNRAPRETEVYELRCYACHRVVEIPCSEVKAGAGICPKCGARLEIRWRDEAEV